MYQNEINGAISYHKNRINELNKVVAEDSKINEVYWRTLAVDKIFPYPEIENEDEWNAAREAWRFLGSRDYRGIVADALIKAIEFGPNLNNVWVIMDCYNNLQDIFHSKEDAEQVRDEDHPGYFVEKWYLG